MRKITPNGTAIKQLREQLDRLSTQKEFANAIGVSVRMLRKIENESARLSLQLLDRTAKVLGVHRSTIVREAPLLPTDTEVSDRVNDGWDRERLIPRHDWDLARATIDDGTLYDEASNSHDISGIIETPLTDETSLYAEELFALLDRLTYSHRDVLATIPMPEQIATRRRLRQLMVLLRGNDVWIYQTSIYRRLPERYDLPSPDEPSELQRRFVVALGPPGEYGETTMKVPVDNGQPYALPAWDTLVAKLKASKC